MAEKKLRRPVVTGGAAGIDNGTIDPTITETPAAAQAPPLDRSNSLTDLAARINAEHEATAIALTRGFEHAVVAGELLIEAKSQLRHGQWLPWLEANCRVSSRSARLYMQLARNRQELGQIGNVADLTVQGAIRQLAPPQRYEPPPQLEDFEDEDELWEWAAQQCEEPFTDFDVEAADLDWLITKIMRVARLPVSVSFYLNAEELGCRSSVAAIPYDDLIDSIKRLVPYAQEKDAGQIIRIETTDPVPAAIKIKLTAMWLLGRLLNEIDERQNISDEKLEQRGDAAHAEYMAAIENKIFELGIAAVDTNNTI
jgi:Protein of unknown function (DUF3102)